mgnify:CR=1 FL=1
MLERLFDRSPDTAVQYDGQSDCNQLIVKNVPHVDQIDAVNGNSDAVVRESADLLYNLTVLWASAGVRPEDVWREMERRELLQGIAEKLPKSSPKVRKTQAAATTPPAPPVAVRRRIVALEGRSLRKRH